MCARRSGKSAYDSPKNGYTSCFGCKFGGGEKADVGNCSYTENYVTDAEFNSLPARFQEQVKRMALHNQQQSVPGWNQYYNPVAHPGRYRRVGECRPPPLFFLFLFLFFDDMFTNVILYIHPHVMHCSLFSDWLRERIFFDALRKDDPYVISRLGFRAPNIYVMHVIA